MKPSLTLKLDQLTARLQEIDRIVASEDATRDNFVEYGHRLERLIAGVKAELAGGASA